MEEIKRRWGSEKIIEANDKYIIKRVVVDAGMTTDRYFYQEKDKTLYILLGTGEIHTFDGEEMKTIGFPPYISYRILPRTPYEISAGIRGIVFLDVSTPDASDKEFM